MAASSASIAASKLLNLRNPALQNLIRRHLLHPSAAAASSSHLLQPVPSSPNLSGDAGSPNLFTNPRDLNVNASSFPMTLQWPIGSSVMQIEAARKSVPAASEDEVDDDFIDDDDVDDDDDDDDNDDEGDYADELDDDEYISGKGLRHK